MAVTYLRGNTRKLKVRGGQMIEKTRSLLRPFEVELSLSRMSDVKYL